MSLKRRRFWYRRSYMLLAYPTDCTCFNVYELHVRTVRSVSCVDLLRLLQVKYSVEIMKHEFIRETYYRK